MLVQSLSTDYELLYDLVCKSQQKIATIIDYEHFKDLLMWFKMNGKNTGIWTCELSTRNFVLNSSGNGEKDFIELCEKLNLRFFSTAKKYAINVHNIDTANFS